MDNTGWGNTEQDARLFVYQIELKALEAEVLGMYFDNQERLGNREVIKWPGSAFRGCSADMRGIAVLTRKLLALTVNPEESVQKLGRHIVDFALLFKRLLLHEMAEGSYNICVAPWLAPARFDPLESERRDRELAQLINNDCFTHDALCELLATDKALLQEFEATYNDVKDEPRLSVDDKIDLCVQMVARVLSLDYPRAGGYTGMQVLQDLSLLPSAEWSPERRDFDTWLRVRFPEIAAYGEECWTPEEMDSNPPWPFKEPLRRYIDAGVLYEWSWVEQSINAADWQGMQTICTVIQSDAWDVALEVFAQRLYTEGEEGLKRFQ
jgi:hypothetical protein